MVLEQLISLRTAVKKPASMVIVGGIVSVVCLAVSFLIFRKSVGLFTTLLITIAMTPFMVNLLKYEEAATEEEIERRKDLGLLQRHEDVLKVYVYFFGGMILALTIVFLMLPESVVQQIFEDQINEINIIRGKFLFFDTFQTIVLNNISVLFISFLFSFLFGAGAVFILAWNASVLSTAIGLVAKSLGGVTGLPFAVLVFFPHGSLEILAYFIGAVAGGLVSAAITRRRSTHFWRVVKDSLILLLISVIILIVAAGIETMSIHI